MVDKNCGLFRASYGKLSLGLFRNDNGEVKYDQPEVIGATVELVIAAEALVGQRLPTLTTL